MGWATAMPPPHLLPPKKHDEADLLEVKVSAPISIRMDSSPKKKTGHCSFLPFLTFGNVLMLRPMLRAAPVGALTQMIVAWLDANPNINCFKFRLFESAQPGE